MHEHRKQFMKLLQNDERLLRLLANNKAFWNDKLDAERRYSILPADKIYTGIQCPFVTVQVGGDNLIGTNLADVFVYVRCYNEPDKTFVKIDDVLSRIKTLLHKSRFQGYEDGTVGVDTVYESTGAELSDQAYNLNFRESRYRLTYL